MISKITLVQLVGSALLLATPAMAQVTLDQWGTYATTVSSDCADYCEPDTDFSWFLGLTFEVTNSGELATIIDATSSVARGNAFAEASVQGGLGPAVRVNAESAAGSWMDGTGTAVQGYTYVGLVADTIDVNATLTGTIGNPDSDPATGLAAQVGYVGDANVATMVFANAVGGLYAPDGSVELETTTDGAVNLSDVLSIPVSPGDQFYLVVSSAATAGGLNAFAESLGTLTVSFSPADAANLQAAGGAAQVPGLSPVSLVILVLILGAAGFLFRVRKVGAL